VTSERKTAIALGILLILGIAFGMANTVPALEKPDYLATLATMRTRVLVAVFFQAAMAIAYVCIAALFYQVIKNHDGKLGTAYLGFRMIGAAFLFVGIASLSLLLSLSGNFLSAGSPGSGYFQTLGELLRKGRDLLNHVGMILPWAIGSLILCYCMLRMKAIPAWLSVWGIAASGASILATVILMLEFIKIISPIYFILTLPYGLFELVLAGFLLVRGFNPSMVKSTENGGIA
jgi:hypothetical protein